MVRRNAQNDWVWGLQVCRDLNGNSTWSGLAAAAPGLTSGKPTMSSMLAQHYSSNSEIEDYQPLHFSLWPPCDWLVWKDISFCNYHVNLCATQTWTPTTATTHAKQFHHLCSHAFRDQPIPHTPTSSPLENHRLLQCSPSSNLRIHDLKTAMFVQFSVR